MRSPIKALVLLLALTVPAVAGAQPYHDRHRGGDDRDFQEDRWDQRYEYEDDWDGNARYDRRHSRHRIIIPNGHYPPPGLCRIWYPNRHPGHQPPPVRCGRIKGKHLGRALVLTHHGVFHTWRDWHRYYDARHRRAFMKKRKKWQKEHGPRLRRKPYRHGPKARIRINVGGVWVFGF